MNLIFVLGCDESELKMLYKIHEKKKSEYDRINFLVDRIKECKANIELGIIEEDWGPVREKFFYAAYKCAWAQYKGRMSDASMRFSPKANIEERTKYYRNLDKLRKENK